MVAGSASAQTSTSTSNSSGSGVGSGNVALVHLSFLNHNSGVAATSATKGTKPTFSQPFTQVGVSGMFAIDEGWAIAPILALSIPTQETTEENADRYAHYFAVRAHASVGYDIDLHFGPGLLAYQIKGSGGTIILNNGSGSSTFGLPDETRTSTLLTWDLGADYQYDIFRVGLALLITSPFDSKKMAMSHMLTFGVEVY